MNGRKNNVLGPILVVFIPASSNEIIKQFEDLIFAAFLELLFRDFEVLFSDGFLVNYNYPSHLISSSLPITEDGKA
jgi:hypothetical protein